jgi:hypothetical protein
MNFKLTGAIILLLPFMALATETEICLGDTYEKVNKLKGFPKEVSFIKNTTKTMAGSNEEKFEAVTFHKDKTIYVFNAVNNRLCKLVNSTIDKNSLVCAKSFKSRQCS